MVKESVDIWFDFSNPPHVNLFRPILKHFKDKGLVTYSTAREFVETTGLLKKYGIAYQNFGKHGGKNRLSKTLNLISRNIKLYRNIPDFRYSVSSSFEAPEISWLKRRPAIVFDDNEIAPNWLYAKFAKYVISPSVIKVEEWEKSGIKRKKVIQYNGFKEDIYIADYIPDKNFLDHLPFKRFVTVRPENLFAAYVPKKTVTIVPELIDALTDAGYNILFLPRYAIDKSYVKTRPNIFMPDLPLNGLDVCFYSEAVLTGAGTFSREAAILRTPAVSFFAGKKLLSVDRNMFESGMAYHSRNVREIISYLTSNRRKVTGLDFNRSKTVQEEVFNILDNIILKHD